MAGPVDDVAAGLYGVDQASVGALTSAYVRARDADPKCSYGDFAAVSHPVDAELAALLTGLVCDGIIAPGYAPGTVATLSRKKNGRFLIMEADEAYAPPRHEVREVSGLRLTQERDDTALSTTLLNDVACGTLPAAAAEDLLLGLAVLRYTQSNSVCYLQNGMTLGIGAGQQSRVDCTRLAGAKTDIWWLRRHPAVRALAFRPHVRRQDLINWQIRFIEGDLTPDENTRMSAALSAPAPDLADEQRTQWLAGLDQVAFASDGCLAVSRQRRPAAPARRQLHCRAGRVDPVQRSGGGLPRAPDHSRPYRPPAVPPLTGEMPR